MSLLYNKIIKNKIEDKTISKSDVAVTLFTLVIYTTLKLFPHRK